MLRQVGIGAAAALTAGLLAVGCGSDGDTIIVGGTSDLNNTDQFGATSIGSNNLAPDGGAWSPDGTDQSGVRIIWNQDLGTSDCASQADNSAVVLVTTSDGRTFVTTYNGSLTPPVELEATDHDNTSFDIDSAGVQFLQLSGYANASATNDVVNNVRQNNGAIVLVMAGSTSYDDPTLNITNFGGNTTNKRGIHRALWQWLYWPAFRGQERIFADATTNRVGSITATTSRYYAAPTNEFRYGWQVNAGAELSLNVATGARAAVSGARTGSSATGSGTPNSPAADVLGFALMSDGYQGESQWEGKDVTVDSQSNNRHQVTSTSGTPKSTFTPGEAVSLLHLVYTQIVTSLDAGGTNTGDFLGGATSALFHSSFNLASLSFDAVARVNPPVASSSRNVAFNAGFLTYNNVLVTNYVETTPSFNLTTFDPYGITGTEQVILKLVARQSATGGSTPASIQDLATRTSATGVHRQFDPASTVGQESETQDIDMTGASIYGRDESLAETVIFFQSKDATNTGGQEDSGTNTGNTDTALYAALLSQSDYTGTATGSTDGDLVTGATNPLLVSRHDADAFGGTVSNPVTEFSDAVAAVGVGMNRTGSYIVAGYIQMEGSSTTTAYTRRRTLKAVVYETVRLGQTTIPFASRFSAPIEVSDPSSGAGSTTTANNGQGSTNVENNLPVNRWEFQGSAGYRCGFQSNDQIFWVLWEQSAGTEDRLFARALAVTLPAAGSPTFITASNGVVELDEQSSEQVVTDNLDTDANGSLDRSQVNFLNGELASGTGGGTSTYTTAPNTVEYGITNVQSCDLGVAGTAQNASTGGLFLVYVKTTDNTRQTITGGVSTGDSDGFDRHIFANSILVGAAADQGRVLIDSNFNEDDLSGASQTTGSDIFTLVALGSPIAVNSSNTNQQNSTGNQITGALVFFTQPTQANASNTSDALYARYFDASAKFRAGTSTGTATDFQASFVPTVASGSFLAPNRLDHLTGGDVESALSGTPVVSGTTSMIIWTEDAHHWGNGSADGRTFLTSAGSPAPVLVDQDKATNVVSGLFSHATNDSCALVDGIYGVKKRDHSGANQRQLFRTGKRSLP